MSNERTLDIPRKRLGEVADPDHRWPSGWWVLPLFVLDVIVLVVFLPRALCILNQWLQHLAESLRL
jgi:hypothetical protein